MRIDVDPFSGFCFGVVHAVRTAEELLDKGDELYCLGEIVHNQQEVDRLKAKGLVFIDHEAFKTLQNVNVLIRAHGEPPETYQIAQQNNINIIDASCKVVLGLQRKVKRAWEEMQEKNGQVMIFGKSEHPEVIGLNGQTDENAIIIRSVSEAKQFDFKTPVRLFAQTTMSIHVYERLKDYISELLSKNDCDDFKAYNSICKQVSNREAHIQEFAEEHDVIVFAGGKNSSNAKFLFSICKEANEKSYFISELGDISCEWFKNIDSIGISGATSTPQWFMEQVKQKIEHECI